MPPEKELMKLKELRDRLQYIVDNAPESGVITVQFLADLLQQTEG